MADFDKPHIDISARVQKRSYQSPPQNVGGGAAPRLRDQHGPLLLAQMRASFIEAEAARPADQRIEQADGVFLEVDLRKGAKPEATLERKSEKIRPGAVKQAENEQTRVLLYVPDEARPVLEEIFDEYINGPLKENGEAPRRDKVDPINAIRRARLETFWTDEPTALPQDAQDEIWWEAWCYAGMEGKVRDAALAIDCVVAEEHYWLKFPETTVIPIRAKRVAIELLLFATAGVSELRRASASPVFFVEMEGEEQSQWTGDLAERITWPANDAPAVCLLDTGVNRGHMLIEPALSADDLLTIDADWGTSDHEPHGTHMAGLALHGDLFPVLQDTSAIELTHRAESVKVLPPNGFPPNDPQSYGPITQAAAARAEINKPERRRVFCLSVTNDNVSGARPTTWSAAIDQAAVGQMAGDDSDAPRRLFVLSGGNIPALIDATQITDASEWPIEDPAQAWNALTVGGYTNKTDIDDAGFEDWSALAEGGDLSPFSRTSVTWPDSTTPFKPDVVFEAGNRGISPAGTEALNLDSLALLTTGENTAQQPLVPFAATSAAAAQGARLATRLVADHPELWPETIRALIVHSAEWTPNMHAQLAAAGNMSERSELLRRFGHGVPDFLRASQSASNHLALVAQNEIQPFRVQSGQKKFGECHYYKLPWPTAVLEALGAQDVRLKISLSYFVVPNPGRSASFDAQRYQSFGLRFDLRRRNESEQDFLERTNALERDNPQAAGPAAVANTGWKFGPNSVSAGSLHCDEWVGPAIQLATRNILCIKPVTGWWKDSAAGCRKSARYAVVATVSAPSIEVDLHTPILNLVQNAVQIEIGT